MAPTTSTAAKNGKNGKNLNKKQQKGNKKPVNNNKTNKNKYQKKSKKPVDDELANKKKKAKLIVTKRKEKTIRVSNKDVNYSVCISTSILNNCKNLEQITYTLYQVAKSCSLYNVNEIVILKDNVKERSSTSADNEKDGHLSKDMIIATILQYFVTPPYLVKSIFKKKYWKYFKYCENLPRLTSLPFMRHHSQDVENQEQNRYREGLSIKMKHPNKEKKNESYNQTKYINIGQTDMLELKNQLIPFNVRVTVDTVERKVVSPEEAYGDYFGMKSSYGYHIRVVEKFSKIFMDAVVNYSQTLWINSGDFYFNPESKQYYKVETNIPKLNKIVKKTSDEQPNKEGGANIEEDNEEDQVPQILLMFGKWDLLSKNFKKTSVQDFEGANLFEFFDAELQLPNAIPMGNIKTEDAVMIAMTMINTLY